MESNNILFVLCYNFVLKRSLRFASYIIFWVQYLLGTFLSICNSSKFYRQICTSMYGESDMSFIYYKVPCSQPTLEFGMNHIAVILRQVKGLVCYNSHIIGKSDNNSVTCSWQWFYWLQTCSSEISAKNVSVIKNGRQFVLRKDYWKEIIDISIILIIKSFIDLKYYFWVYLLFLSLFTVLSGFTKMNLSHIEKYCYTFYFFIGTLKTLINRN